MNMRVYVLRRLLQGALTLLLVSIAIFAALRAAPGDAADLIAAGGSGAEAAAQAGSEDQIASPPRGPRPQPPPVAPVRRLALRHGHPRLGRLLRHRPQRLG